MSFLTIPSTLIEVGKAVKKEIFSLVKGNLDDHEERLSNVEAVGTAVEILNNDVIISNPSNTFTGMSYFKAPFDFTLSACSIQIFEKGGITSGELEVDILKNTSPDDTGMTTVFTTKPNIDFDTATDYEEDSGVFSGTGQVNEGDILRFDITSIPQGYSRFRIVLRGAL